MCQGMDVEMRDTHVPGYGFEGMGYTCPRVWMWRCRVHMYQGMDLEVWGSHVPGYGCGGVGCTCTRIWTWRSEEIQGLRFLLAPHGFQGLNTG